MDCSIFHQTLEEIDLGRMAPLSSPDLRLPLTRRFGVVQRSANGVAKIRSIDDFAESLVNDTVTISRRIRMGRLADMLAVARIMHHAHPAEDLLLAKSDFRAAYRGCPILTDHLQFSNILVRDPRSGRVWSSTQLAMPFGAVAAVYAWDRLGGALAFLLQQVLLLPTARYVDDLFWVDFSRYAPETSRLALELISLLGFTLEPGKTPPPASCLDILGVSVALRRHPQGGPYSARLLPEPLKVAV